MITVKEINIDWNEDLPIYASNKYLQAVGDEFGWLGGFDEDGNLLCILPYTLINKKVLRLCRFRLETIILSRDFSAVQERHFLNSVISWLRTKKVDVIIPASTNAVFRTFPDGARAAPYSTWIIDLTNSIEQIWQNISATYRKEIKRASKCGIIIREGSEFVDLAFKIIKETYERSGARFMHINSFKRIIYGLGNHARVMIAFRENVPQSCTAYHYSKYCAYAVHGGTVSSAVPGVMKYLQWHAIETFKNEGVAYFDLMGARVNPLPGSKQEGILLFKKYFGATPRYGFIWKYPINNFKYPIYQIGIKLLMGGDIVDKEKNKLRDSYIFPET